MFTIEKKIKEKWFCLDVNIPCCPGNTNTETLHWDAGKKKMFSKVKKEQPPPKKVKVLLEIFQVYEYYKDIVCISTS